MIVIIKALKIQLLLVAAGVLSIILFTTARPAHSDFPIIVIKAAICIIGTTTDPKRHDERRLAYSRKFCDIEAGKAGFKHGFLRPRIPEIDKDLLNSCRPGMDQDLFYCFGVGKRSHFFVLSRRSIAATAFCFNLSIDFLVAT